jgi:hypothetical protein
MLARRREAEISIDLMKETYRRNVEDEENRKGLIITKSIYGRWLDLSHRDLGDAITDVTIPLQCLVRDSKLILQEASKVGILQDLFQERVFFSTNCLSYFSASFQVSMILAWEKTSPYMYSIRSMEFHMK